MKLTNEQLRKMAHALGYRVEAASWPLSPYRNHYISNGELPPMEAAAERGLVSITPLKRGNPWSADRIYRVTDEGREAVLDALAGMKLSERYALASGWPA